MTISPASMQQRAGLIVQALGHIRRQLRYCIGDAMARFSLAGMADRHARLKGCHKQALRRSKHSTAQVKARCSSAQRVATMSEVKLRSCSRPR